MNWELEFASDLRKVETVRIETLQDLEALYTKYGSELIVDFEEHHIMVYDGYVE